MCSSYYHYYATSYNRKSIRVKKRNVHIHPQGTAISFMQKARRELNDCSVTEWCQKAQLLLTGKCCHCSHLVNFEYIKFSGFPSRQASHRSKWGAEVHPLPSRAVPSPDTDCSWHLKMHLKMLTVRSNTHLLCKCLERSSPLLLLCSCSSLTKPSYSTGCSSLPSSLLPDLQHLLLNFATCYYHWYT